MILGIFCKKYLSLSMKIIILLALFFGATCLHAQSFDTYLSDFEKGTEMMPPYSFDSLYAVDCEINVSKLKPIPAASVKKFINLAQVLQASATAPNTQIPQNTKSVAYYFLKQIQVLPAHKTVLVYAVAESEKYVILLNYDAKGSLVSFAHVIHMKVGKETQLCTSGIDGNFMLNQRLRSYDTKSKKVTKKRTFRYFRLNHSTAIFEKKD